MFPLCCLCLWYNVFSKRFIIHRTPSWNIRHFLTLFWELKQYLIKFKRTRISALKGDHQAVCGFTCIDLSNKVIKNLGTYFSYNSLIKEEPQFLKVFSKAKIVLKLRRFRNLTLEGEIFVFKSLAKSFLSAGSNSPRSHYSGFRNNSDFDLKE